MILSERMKLGREAAQWCIEEVEKLEAVVNALREVDGTFNLRECFEGEEIDALFAALKKENNE